MSNGFMPTYGYRPTSGGVAPRIRGASSRRARLFAGGTYFRAKDPGGRGNNISVALIEYNGGSNAKLIVTNHNTLYSENVSGPVNVKFLDQSLNWNDQVVIDHLTTTPTAHRYSISLQIAPTVSELGTFTFTKPFYVAGLVTATLEPKLTELTPSSTITVSARTQVYDLAQITVTTTPVDPTIPAQSFTGWDLAALRAAVSSNQASWVEMLPRSGTPASSDPLTPPVPLAVKFDEQDDGVDEPVGTAFADTYLTGGDGLPDYPTSEKTGPYRSVVYINYGEQQNGAMGEVSTVYEWVGDSATSGTWRPY